MFIQFGNANVGSQRNFISSESIDCHFDVKIFVDYDLGVDWRSKFTVYGLSVNFSLRNSFFDGINFLDVIGQIIYSGFYYFELRTLVDSDPEIRVKITF